ncbi:spinster family MFS transporter [Phenylobacterium sp.]|uniref:spinster family MFS transporter n=1 Tax=Phenylobacterium sp. TaxID=1871053 RepID=UPI002FE2615B
MSMSDAAAPAAGLTAPAPFPNRAYAWFVVGALSLVNMVSYVERQILTLLFTPIKRDFQLTDTQVSLLAGAAFVIFYVIFGLLFGRLADRSNRKRIIMAGAVFWGLATTACGLAQNFTQLFLARISVGVGEASLGPSALSTISDYFPRERLARAISFYTGSQYVGAGLALVVGGFAIQIVSGLPPLDIPFVGPLRPWQMTFLIVGLGGLLVLIPMSFVREPARRGVAKAPAAGGKADRSQLLGFLGANRRMFLAHFTAFSISSMLGFGTVAWAPTFFIRVHGWAPQDIGYVYGAILAVMGCAGVLAGGRIAEWMESKGVADAYFVLPMISLSATAVFFISAMFAPTAELSLALIFCSTFLSSFPVSLIITALQAVAPNQLRGQLVALYYFIANILGVASGPTVVALLTDYVYRDEMAVGLSLATASAVITPIVVTILALGRAGFRDSLARAAQLYAAPAAA